MYCHHWLSSINASPTLFTNTRSKPYNTHIFRKTWLPAVQNLRVNFHVLVVWEEKKGWETVEKKTWETIKFSKREVFRCRNGWHGRNCILNRHPRYISTFVIILLILFLISFHQIFFKLLCHSIGKTKKEKKIVLVANKFIHINKNRKNKSCSLFST